MISRATPEFWTCFERLPEAVQARARAAYALWLYRRVVFGALEKPTLRFMPDRSAREIAVLAPLVVLTILFGVWPEPVLQTSAAAVDNLVSTATAALSHPAAALAAR